MADATLTSFPAGTSVSCYPIGQCEPYKEQQRVPPLTATATETVASTSVLTYTGIDAGSYYAVGSIEGVVRYHAFRAVDA